MRVLLINPPIRLNKPQYFHPIGLAYVAGALREAGHEVQVLDLNVIRRPADTVHYILPKIDFDMVGLSGLITTFQYNKELMPVLREAYPRAKIIVGGGGFTSDPEIYMGELKPDYGYAGEAEVGIAEFVQLIEAGSIGTNTYATPKNKADLNKMPVPAYDLLPMTDYLNVVKYGRHSDREAAVLTGRGCPMNCNFCYHIFGQGIRYRPVEEVLEELEMYQKGYGVTSLLFGDECITTRQSYMEALCEGMLERNLDFEWICYSRVDTLKEDMLKLMVKAGCITVGFGMESGSQKILDAMNKRTTIEEMETAYQMASKYVHVGTTFIFGYPEEDEESIQETIDFARRNGMRAVVFFLQPYPGTKVFEDNRDYIVRSFGTLGNYYSQLSDAGDPVINLTKWDNDTAIENLKRVRMEANGL